MARSAKTDPIRNFKFRVSINAAGKLKTAATGLDAIGFAVVSGLTVTNEMVGYREGGMNTHPHKFVGQSDFAPVNFSRGVFENQSQLHRWQQFIHSYNQASSGSSSADNDYRCDIFVEVFDHPISSGDYATMQGGLSSSYGSEINLGTARWGFKLFNAWIGAYSLSDLSAGDSGIIIQQMTVHHEGFAIGWNPEELAIVKNYS